MKFKKIGFVSSNKPEAIKALKSLKTINSKIFNCVS